MRKLPNNQGFEILLHDIPQLNQENFPNKTKNEKVPALFIRRLTYIKNATNGMLQEYKHLLKF